MLPGGSNGKESACNAGDPGSMPGSRKSFGKGNDYPLEYYAWRIPWTEEPGIVHGGHKESDMAEQLTQTHIKN